MTDETKEALKEMEEARNEVDKLCMWNDAYSSDKSKDYLDSEAMSDKWIDKLYGRGEQLTKLLVSHYLQDLIKT